jgi:hypothetical protein
MKNSPFLLLLMFLVFLGFRNGNCQNSIGALEQYKNCFLQVTDGNSTNCKNANSIMLNWQNKCTEPMDFQYAIQRTDGTWQVRSISSVQPNDKIGSDIHHCKTSGKYLWWARPSDKSSILIFPSRESIQKGTY